MEDHIIFGVKTLRDKNYVAYPERLEGKFNPLDVVERKDIEIDGRTYVFLEGKRKSRGFVTLVYVDERELWP